MALDSAIPLQVRPPEIASPAQSIGQIMQLGGMASEIALRRQQAEQAAANTEKIRFQAEQDNRDLEDEKTIQAAQKDPEKALAFGKGDFSSISGLVQPKTLQTVMANRAALVEKQMTNDTNALALTEKQHQRIGESLGGLKHLAESYDDPAQGFAAARAAFPGAVDELVKDKALNAGTFPSDITSLDDIDHLLAVNNAYQGVNAEALKNKQTKAEIAAKEAAATESTHKGEQAKAEADLTNFKLQAAKGAMQGGGISNPEQAVETLIHQNEYPAAFQHAVANGKLAAAGADPTVLGAQAKAFHDAVAKVYETEVLPALPETQRTKVKQALADLQATGPLRQQEVQQTAAINRQGQEHVTAQGEYQKSIQELNASAADATRLHNLISAAQGGNKAAPGLIPIAELRAYLNRINSTELRSVSSQAGTWADRIEGFLKGATEGQPVPPDILKATDELAGLQIQQAEQKHGGSVTAINKARGENFPALKAADLGYKGPAPARETTKAEYDALPVGSVYTRNGQQFRKK